MSEEEQPAKNDPLAAASRRNIDDARVARIGLERRGKRRNILFHDELMCSVGLLESAWRIVDDLEILVCLCRVYSRSKPRPTRRRVLKALLRTMSHDRSWFSPTTTRKRVVAEDESLVDEEEDEEDEEDDYAVGRRVLDELALFGSWRRAASVSTGHALDSSAVWWWLGARLASAGVFDLIPLPWPMTIGYRALVAHPLEQRTVAAAAGASTTPSEGKLWWATSRGALLAAFVDKKTIGGLACAPRLRALFNLDTSMADVVNHAKASVSALPLAIVSVVAARILAFILFGPSRLDQVAEDLVRRGDQRTTAELKRRRRRRRERENSTHLPPRKTAAYSNFSQLV